MSFRRIIAAVLAIVVTAPLTGCIGFSGPNDIRNSIARSHDVQLQKDEAFSVGPLGVLLASTLAGSYLPVKLDGVHSVDWGEYTVRASSGEPVVLRDLELAGWERVVRVRGPGEELVVMVDEGGDTVRGLLVLEASGNQLQIIRARGDFEKILDNLMDSNLVPELRDDTLVLNLQSGTEGAKVAPPP